MLDQGAVLVIVVLSAFQPTGSTTEGFARRALDKPTATLQQFTTKAQCETAAERWRDDLEEKPLEGRTVRVFCVTP